MVRAKLVCVQVTENTDNATANPQKTGETVTFGTVYNQLDSADDNNFSKYTPYANMMMSVTNAALFGHFKQGQAYYFDIVPVQ